jgi:glycine hydroxymethyltransferase
MSRLLNYLEKTKKENYHPAAIAYLASLEQIEKTAPNIASAIIQELKDQRSHVKLIASENYCSYATQLAMGNWLTDKYSEGYPQHRFYAGCENVDLIEQACVDELKNLFGAEHAYVQPHSGADANLVAFWSIIVNRVQNAEVEKLGRKTLDELTPEEYEKVRQIMLNQKVMGLSLNSGGHLTHGYKHNISSKMMQAVLYDVNPETELLDYAQLAKQVQQEKPLILLAGYSAHPRKLNFRKFREIADSVGAVLMVDMAHFAGLVAGKAFTGDFNPIPFADIVTSTTHKTLRGPRGGFVLCKNEFAEIVNKGCPLVLGGPLPHVLAAKAIAFKEANTPEFCKYAQKVIDNSQAMAERFLEKGFRLVTGGTENHLMIVDLTQVGLNGRVAESALRAAKLTVNRNAIPYDKNGAWFTSGIRLGTPALTTLGMGREEVRTIADCIIKILENTKPITVAKTGLPSKINGVTEPSVLSNVQQELSDLLTKFPLYPEICVEST